MIYSSPKQGKPFPTVNPFVRWAFVLALAAAAGIAVSYYWRVFFYLDLRFPPLAVTLGCVGFAWAVAAACALLRRVGDFAARSAVCIFLCGVLFVFANPPLQTPDETDHYLRSYAISMGRFDFDASRGYPEDVGYLLEAFPGAWVNAHTSAGLGADPDTGADKPYNTAGYALKQYGSEGRIESIADSFHLYLNREALDSQPESVTEPVSFLILPFLPGALGMALARLAGLGALGCLYGGRLVNLLAYTALCWLALKKAERSRAALLCLMLLPMSLFMGASLSYDATLLGCYYLMLALLTRWEWDTPTAALYAAAAVFVNIAKPYLNLLWPLLPLLLTRGEHKAKGKRWQWLAATLAGALCATMLVEWYGTAFRHNYPVIARQGGETVSGGAQLGFILSNPLRYLAVVLGTLYENDFFVGQLGLFGWKDLPVALLNLTGPLVLAAAALFCANPREGLGRRRAAGLGVFALVYAAGAMTAMYITYTPVGMVRIVGLQARYFLPVWLILVLLAAALLRRCVVVRLDAGRVALPLFGGYAVLGAVLLFQHYFVGPFYTIPVG